MECLAGPGMFSWVDTCSAKSLVHVVMVYQAACKGQKKVQSIKSVGEGLWRSQLTYVNQSLIFNAQPDFLKNYFMRHIHVHVHVPSVGSPD